MLLSELRQLVRCIILEDVGPRTHLVNQDDFEAVFNDYNDYTKRKGVKIFAALEMLDAFRPYTELARLGAVYRFTPQDVAHLLKKGDNNVLKPAFRGKKNVKVFDQAEITAITLKLESPEIRERLLDKMATSIVRHFKGMKIDEVLAVDSTYGMARDLAERVAAGLGVPLGSPVEKESEPSKIDWDFKEFERWVRDDAPKSAAAAGKPLEDYIRGTLQGLDSVDLRQVTGAIKKGRKPSIARDIPQNRRRFWNFFKKMQVNEMSKRVLVVDDNVASGWTLLHAAKRLRDAGLEPFFAVGYVW